MITAAAAIATRTGVTFRVTEVSQLQLAGSRSAAAAI
jgi:hypothetical protein